MAELDHAAELATDAVDEAVSVARNHINWMWGGALAGFGIGFAAGYFVSMKRLETKYEKRAEDEIDKMRDHFRQRLVVREDKPELSDLNKRVAALGYRETKPPVPVQEPGGLNTGPQEEVVQRNVFQMDDTSKSAEEGWDYEVELEARKGKEIYIIHQDEYGAEDNEEITLSYYGGDDILCDASDRIIDDQAKLVANCLDRFGHGSGDKNTVYVRNETLGIDLEVIKSDKTYAEEVHGFKHEDPPARRLPKRQE